MYPPPDYMRSVDFAQQTQQTQQHQMAPPTYVRRYSPSQCSSECSSVRSRSVRSNANNSNASFMGGGQFMPGDPGGFLFPAMPTNCYGEMSESTDCGPYPLGFVFPGRSSGTYPAHRLHQNQHNHFMHPEQRPPFMHHHHHHHQQQQQQQQKQQQQQQMAQNLNQSQPAIKNPPQKKVTWNLPPSGAQTPQPGQYSATPSMLSGTTLNASVPAFFPPQQYQQVTPSPPPPPQIVRPAIHPSYITSNPHMAPPGLEGSDMQYSSTSIPPVPLGPAAFSYAALQQQQYPQQQQQPSFDGPKPSQYMEFKRRQQYEQQLQQ